MGWEAIEGVRRTAWRARPTDASGMSRKPNRDAKNAEKADIKGGGTEELPDETDAL